MRRQRVLRRLLRKYRDAKKISKDIYHQFYLGSKGNQFKNKTVLIEAIHRMKQEKIREKQLAEQREARRAKNTIRKEKRVAKKLEQLTGAVKATPAAEKKAEAPAKAAPAKKEEPKKAEPAKTAPAKAAPAKEAPKAAAPAKAAPAKEAPKAAAPAKKAEPAKKK